MRYVSKENLSQFWGGVKSWLNDKFTITKNKITDWPSTFPPSSHTHTISQITDLQNQLNGKSSTSHNHDGRYLRVGDIEDKGSVTLDSTKSLTTTFPTPSKEGILCKFTVKYIIHGSGYKDIYVKVPSNINLFLWVIDGTYSPENPSVPTMIFAGNGITFNRSSEGSIFFYYTYLF